MPNRSNRSPPMLKPQIPKFVTFILNRLNTAEQQSYIVGGAVRDAYLSRPITDWDVATSAPSEEIKNMFKDVKLFALKENTVTLVNSGHSFEVSTFKGSKNCIKEDLGLRDFTVNAIAYNSEKDEVLDYYGSRKDMAQKVIRAVGDPKARFREDPLRILRAVRLANELRFRVDTKTQKAIINMAHLLKRVAPERIREELIKVLLSPRPSTGFKMMRRTGLLEYILPELLEGYLKRQNTHHRYTIFRHIVETIDRVEPVPVLRLTALLHDIAKPRVRKKIDGKWRFYGHEEASAGLSEEIMGRLTFSRDMIRKVTNLIRHHMIDYNSGWSDGAVRRLIRRVGRGQIMDLLDFRRADILAHGLHIHELESLSELKKRVEKLSKIPMVTKTNELAIDGHKVMQFLGISSGPEVGNILKELMEKVTDKPELNTEDALTALLGQMKAT